MLWHSDHLEHEVPDKVLDEAHRDVCLSDRELVRLLRDDADHIAKFALDGELLDGFDDILALNGSHRGANAQTAQVAQGQEKFLQRLVSQDELELQAVEEKNIRFLHLVNVSSLVLDIEVETALFGLVGLSLLALVVAASLFVLQVSYVFV